MGRRKRLDEPIEIKVTITRREFLVIKKMAEPHGLGPYEYARNIISGWIRDKVLAKYRYFYDRMSLRELVEFFGDLDDDGGVQFNSSAAKALRDKLNAEDEG